MSPAQKDKTGRFHLCSRAGEMDFTEAEPRIRRLAREWEATISGDPAMGIEDLLQELRWRYWAYWQKTGDHPRSGLMRNWARAAMRSMGYVGDDKAPYIRREPQVVLAGDIAPGMDEEEFLDIASCRKTSRYAQPTSCKQTEDEWD